MSSPPAQNEAATSQAGLRQVRTALQNQLQPDAARLFRKGGTNAVDFDVVNVDREGRAEPSTLESEAAVREYLQSHASVSTSKTGTTLATARY